MNASPYRVGIDIVNVHHIHDSIARFGDRFLQRIYTQEERSYCESLTSTAAILRSLAARFAAKEAAIKVLRPDTNLFLDWRTVEVRRSTAGWCDIVLSDNAQTLADQRRIVALSLSMSHEEEYATAIVIADFLA